MALVAHRSKAEPGGVSAAMARDWEGLDYHSPRPKELDSASMANSSRAMWLVVFIIVAGEIAHGATRRGEQSREP
jgi:hypothetical protein